MLATKAQSATNIFWTKGFDAVMLQNNNVCVIIKCFFSAKTNITMTEYDFKTKDLMNIQRLSKDKNPSGCGISLPEKSAS